MVRELSSEKRERFLRAALKLFAANGIQNTSTAEIARAAGTASGTLFLYFPTKQDLIDELAILISREESGHIYRIAGAFHDRAGCLLHDLDRVRALAVGKRRCVSVLAANPGFWV